MSAVIEVEKLSKAYRLGQFNTGALSKDIERWWALARGKEDPFQKIGEVNDRTSTTTSDIVWSLQDIDFQVEAGDTVGIIGSNGAGKSTLLKILSRVTSPTRGEVRLKGRVASLLEVGTGFHPELTGRENIFLNGAILGMRKKEIRKKFSEIVEFAGVARYIDTPVKRYSSGMYVRLAFAVAAHLDSEILIVDEVLAVGDAEFQKKCLSKMDNVSKNEGRTILFVSHNMTSVGNICKYGIVMANGTKDFYGSSHDAIAHYLSTARKFSATDIKDRQDRVGNGALRFVDFQLLNGRGIKTNFFSPSEPITFEVHYEVKDRDFDFAGCHFSIDLIDDEGNVILNHRNSLTGQLFSSEEIKNHGSLKFTVANFPVISGTYYISCNCVKEGRQYLDNVKNITTFEIEDGLPYNYTKSISQGIIGVQGDWSIHS